MNNLSSVMVGPVGITIALVLLALLGAREVAGVSAGPRWQALTHALTVAAIPLLVIFLAAVIVLIAGAFR